jgi:hypothetical protein
LTFWYEGEQLNQDSTRKMQQVFQIVSSQNYYTVDFDPNFCKVHRDTDASEVVPGRPIWKHTLRCLHLTIEKDIKKNVTQMYKAHGAQKPTQKPLKGGRPTREYKDIPNVENHGSLVMDQSPYVAGVSGEYSVTLHVGKNDGEALCDCDFFDRDRLSKLFSGLFIYDANYMVPVYKEKDQRPNYGRLLDYMAILFEYQLAGSSTFYTYGGVDDYGTQYLSYGSRKHGATHKRNEHSTSYSDKANSTLKHSSGREEMKRPPKDSSTREEIKRPLKDASTVDRAGYARSTLVGQYPNSSVQDMNQHVPLLLTAAAPDIAHVAGIAGVGALAAQALSDGAPEIGPKPQKRYKKIKFLEDPPQ